LRNKDCRKKELGLIRYCIILSFCILSFSLYAQQPLSDSIETSIDTLHFSISKDSLNLPSDSIKQVNSDTLLYKGYQVSKNAIGNVVTYNAEDSICIDVLNRKAYLYRKAVVLYDDLDLRADFIEIDFKNNELYASGIADSAGIVHGDPVLKQGDGEYKAQEMRYNFTTKKGKISHVITTEGEGYIHGGQVKKMEDFSYIKGGKYTTCDLSHPHFSIGFTKAKIIPNKSIITGPAYVSFLDIPTFLAIPFGFFPLQKTRASGLVMPSFRETANRGFAFEGIGFYFGINDNIDLLLSGDIFTRGSWAVKAVSNYVFRYKCNGQLELSFARNLLGERYTPSFQLSNDFKVYWKHQQDPKSHPTTRFSSYVNFVTKSYNKYNPSTANDYLSNQYASKINFSTNIKSIFFMDAALSYNQNTQTGITNLALPQMSMSVNQFYPFRSTKKKSGKLKWYDNISMKWSSQFNNQIDTYDSLLLKTETWENMKLGMMHDIPLTIPIKIGKSLNWNTNIRFSEKWYFQSIEKQFITEEDSLGYIYSSIKDHFKRKFYALHDLSASTSMETKIYFTYQTKKSGAVAMRHVMTPRLSFNYQPKLNNQVRGTYFNSVTGQEVEYSYFENGMFGTPILKSQMYGEIRIGNNVELKVHSKRDTISGFKKISIFDDLSVTLQYDFIADSMRLKPLSITGRTTLFQQLYLTYYLNFDPYCLDEKGYRIAMTEWAANRRLFRFSNANFKIGLNWRLDQNLFSKMKKKTANKPQNPTPASDALGIPASRPDFSMPWSFTLNYTFAYNIQENTLYYQNIEPKQYNHDIIQSLNIVGDVNLSKKWKIGISTGYDFKNKEITYTSIDIYRDLHCWEMRFNWVPFGFHKGYSFTINVKASVLQDIKYNLKRDFRDNLY
jgi:hypothetical protein